MELLAPAGNLEKLKFAYLYGADAAYIGLGNFSLRQTSLEECANREGLLKIKKNKKLFAVANIFFHEDQIKTLRDYLPLMADLPFDGLVVSDPGAIAVLRQNLPDLPLHLSTQASCLNSESVKFYQAQGISRIILGRELSLNEIGKIRQAAPDMELEVFGHGAMCIAYSGRCLLSNYLAERRSANQGDCAHACRWQYRVLEEAKRPGEYLPISEGGDFSTILSSRDLCMIDYLGELKEAGVDAIKIEGRMKSVYYAAVITRAYRKALDALNGEEIRNLKDFKNEVSAVSHRELSTGFYFDSEQSTRPTLKEYQVSRRFLGIIGPQIEPNLYRIEVKNNITHDMTLEYIGPDVFGITDTDFILLDKKKQPALKAAHGQEFYLKTSCKIKPGYLVRL